MPRNSRASAVKKPRTAPLSVGTTRRAKPVWECPAATALPVATPVSPRARPAVAASRRMDRLDAMTCPIFGHQDSGPPPDAGLADRCSAIGSLGGSHNGYSLVVFTALVGKVKTSGTPVASLTWLCPGQAQDRPRPCQATRRPRGGWAVISRRPFG